MNFSDNDLSIIRYRLARRFPSLSMTIQNLYPVVNSTKCAHEPSGTALIVRVPPLGRVWLLAPNDGYTLDDVLPEEWQNCLHHDDGHIEYIPEFITGTESVVEWITEFIRQSNQATTTSQGGKVTIYSTTV